MVSYLQLVILGISVVILGFAYGIVSDMADVFIPLYQYAGTDLAGQTDADADYGFSVMVAVFHTYLIIAGIAITLFIYVMSQKPERGW